MNRIETFPSLSDRPGLTHGFIPRIPGIDVEVDRETALQRLVSEHQTLLQAAGLGRFPLRNACQVHGDRVIRLQSPQVATHAQAADGLATDQPGIVLGVYVADCAPVYLVDSARPAIALLHSGKKGSALGIVRQGVQLMRAAFGSRPRDLIVQIGPCIRPPHYEIDFAARIRSDAIEAGVGQVEDCGRDTAADLERYYSYRLAKGKTGRMLAFLALTP